MIVKSYLIENNIESLNKNKVLFYGENNGLKQDIKIKIKSSNQTAEIINKASILLCCDGGLMHAANAVNTPIVPLLARLNEQMQLTDSICSFAVFDELDVNNIDINNIYKMCIEASDFVENSSTSLS